MPVLPGAIGVTLGSTSHFVMRFWHNPPPPPPRPLPQPAWIVVIGTIANAIINDKVKRTIFFMCHSPSALLYATNWKRVRYLKLIIFKQNISWIKKLSIDNCVMMSYESLSRLQ